MGGSGKDVRMDLGCICEESGKDLGRAKETTPYAENDKVSGPETEGFFAPIALARVGPFIIIY